MTEERTASHLRSGRVAVYATPAMVTLIERCAAELVEPLMAQGQTTVGVRMDVEHLAPTPLGSQVTVQTELVRVKGGRLIFEAEVRDPEELVGRARHGRAIVETDRFLKRVQAKSRRSMDG